MAEIPYYDSLAQGLGYASVPVPKREEANLSTTTEMDTVPYREPIPIPVVTVQATSRTEDLAVPTVGSNARSGYNGATMKNGPRGLDSDF